MEQINSSMCEIENLDEIVGRCGSSGGQLYGGQGDVDEGMGRYGHLWVDAPGLDGCLVDACLETCIR